MPVFGAVAAQCEPSSRGKMKPTDRRFQPRLCSPGIVPAKANSLCGRSWCERGDRGPPEKKEGHTIFVDYLTVMMVAVVAGAVLTVVYGLMFLEAPLAEQRPWGWAFGIVGLLLGITGLHLVLTWPLPGAYNIVMGEPALYFGLVLLGTAFAIRAGDSLMPLAVLAFFGGMANIFLSIAMLVHGLSRNPPLWAAAYATIGLAAVLSPLVVYRVRQLRWAPLVAGVLLAVGALIFALGGYGAYIEHTSAEEGFGEWLPPAMREGTE